MLSAESAAGKYPVESVTMQQLIINKVEVRHDCYALLSPLLHNYTSPSSNLLCIPLH